MTRHCAVAGLFVLALVQTRAPAEPQTISLPFDPARIGPGVPAFSVRPGYRVTLAAEGIDNARFLEFGADGALFVSRPDKGEIMALRDANGDGVYSPDERTTFVSGHRSVHGLCWRDGWLWFAPSTGIHRAKDTDADGRAETVEEVVPTGRLPGGTGHWWRSLLVGPDRFYTSVGDSGNITDERRTERQKVYSFSLSGSGKDAFCSGIRNTEKLRFRPVVGADGTVTISDEIWGVDHGSDWFGKEYAEKDSQPITNIWPPDEFNRYEVGKFYGHPFVTARGIPRLEHRYVEGMLDLAERNTPPEYEFGAHWAANGWTFLTKESLGEGHAGDAMVALHGSWNSSVRVGYGVHRVLFDRVTGRPFGGLRIVNTVSADGKTILARPVDCAEAPDGSVLFSCDMTGKIYRIAQER